MSNKTRLQTNNINLQDLIDKANNLPDAGSGSGETVNTVYISTNAPTSDIGVDGDIYIQKAE